ncbi:Non-structural maintenance of chromosomes element 3 [Amphibalanus amphitrite]|uniref:Non-structural maintenance of chromosomes element 3 n=1 Tax=Amphibalanus amphitrite TaxID=1232801 RepID=A0A6A4WIX9_AMPAM|nr:non-structural maintenance of chromosomes element 3 homolog [Amphibalanus amphitrite]XP_043246186.1 non-structural maintenance of chromosomes element 3 homolog [Amphibalanus amphitrite]KAF0307376.1 Non-structural maintenance of chromosomes element 3 [Amphibalanus amphitrite]
MPRGRPRQSQNGTRATQDDDDGPLSQSLSQSQSQTQRRSQRRLSPVEEERLAARVVRYVLAAHGRGEPLRREKVRRLALEPQHGGYVNQVLQAADVKLRDVFGMSLEVLPNKRDLLLVNQLPVVENAPPLLAESELQKHGLLVAILALIFMSGDAGVDEDTLWRFLSKLGVHKDHKHECFGNVRKLVTEEFCRAGYLRKEEEVVKGVTVLRFFWGDAASVGVDAVDLLKFVCTIWGDEVEPEQWQEQYERALQLQEAREQREQARQQQ